MQIRENTDSIITTGVQQSRQFSIELDAVSAQLLSDPYSDKILAVVREYTTNAIDSHIAANNPNPVEVHLPTSLEPWFSVKDFGTGLPVGTCENCHGLGRFTTIIKKANSSQELEQSCPECDGTGVYDATLRLYSTYFKSTKRANASQTGCFGLGSKAAFAYADAFTVENRYNGTIRVYACAKSNGIPNICKLSEGPTTEPNGVEVKIPVTDNYDMSKFVAKAKQLFPWMRGPVVDNFKTDYQRPVPEFQNGFWAFYKDAEGQARNCYSIPVKIEYGGILYSVPDNQLPHSFNQTRDFWPTNTCPVFHLSDEVLDITTNREAISFTPETVEIVHSRANQCRQELMAYFQAQFDALDSYPAAVRFLRNNNWGDKLFTFRGAPVSQWHDLDFGKLDNIMVLTYKLRSNRSAAVYLRNIYEHTIILDDLHIGLQNYLSSHNMAHTIVFRPTKENLKLWETILRDWFEVDFKFASEIHTPQARAAKRNNYVKKEGPRIFRFKDDEIHIRPTRQENFSPSDYVIARSDVKLEYEINGFKISHRSLRDKFYVSVVHDEDIVDLPNPRILDALKNILNSQFEAMLWLKEYSHFNNEYYTIGTHVIEALAAGTSQWAPTFTEFHKLSPRQDISDALKLMQIIRTGESIIDFEALLKDYPLLRYLNRYDVDCKLIKDYIALVERDNLRHSPQN